MRHLRTFFAILALAAVGLLPGPSHALAHASAVGTLQAHVASGGHAMHHHGTHGAAASKGCDAARCPTHKPCKSCSLACCAPATAATDAPTLAMATSVFRVRPVRPAADRARSDARLQRTLRPPAASA